MIKIIDAIRDSFVGSEKVYTKGSCFQFYLIIKAICPYAEPWYDGINGHVYAKVGDKFYDIYGELEDAEVLGILYDLRTEENLYKQAFNWKYGDSI
jgi:hypothetical protein